VSSLFEAAIASRTLGCAGAALSEKKRIESANGGRAVEASIGCVELVLAQVARLRLPAAQIFSQRFG
jgi:hypothetical protein